MTRIERVTSIAGKTPTMITDADKRYIVKLSREMGLPFEETSCKMCYVDQAIVIRKKLNEATATEAAQAYVLKDGVDVFFGSIRVNKDTLTDELAEQIIAKGFDKIFFAKCK